MLDRVNKMDYLIKTCSRCEEDLLREYFPRKDRKIYPLCKKCLYQMDKVHCSNCGEIRETKYVLQSVE